MQKHLEKGELSRVELQAHSLKGFASQIAGNALQKVAFELEVAARNHELGRTKELFIQIPMEFEKLKEVLNHFIK